MWNLRYRTDEHRVREAKKKIEKPREANHKRLLKTENKLRAAGREVNGGMS